MENSTEPFNKFAIKLQESFLTIGSKKRIQLMLQYIDITSRDVLLDVGGNTGKITEHDCQANANTNPLSNNHRN